MPDRTTLRIRSILAETYALIETGWTQRALARDHTGRSVSPTSPHATHFCLHGALHNRCDAYSYPSCLDLTTIIRLLSYLAKEPLVLYNWNDMLGRTQTDILDLIRLAITHIDEGHPLP